MEKYDLVVVGSGFGSLFFVQRFLEKQPKARIVIVEWGRLNDAAWQLENMRNSNIDTSLSHKQKSSEKPWGYTIGVGGGTNCWWGQALRLLPSDFEMRSKYGVLQDWPLSYNDLESYYCDVEETMLIAGSDSIAKICPRSRPFPQPPHHMSEPDRILVEAQPDYHFPVTTARASIASEARGRCCSSARCNLCPADAKFTAFNGMRDVMGSPQIEWITEAKVTQIIVEAGRAKGVLFQQKGEGLEIYGDLVVLGANAIQSPAILLASGLDTPATGKGLCEQYACDLEVHLDGVQNFGGGSVSTGLNYLLYDGDHRSEAGAALVNFDNHFRFGLRTEQGRWRETMPLIINVEDAPEDRNRVELTSKGEAFVRHPDVSDYAKKGMDRALKKIDEILAPLPVEEVKFRGFRPTEAHLQCSLRMGKDPETSVVDHLGRHHTVKDLVVVGSAVFSTCPPANPSLTVAALARRSADFIAGSRG